MGAILESDDRKMVPEFQQQNSCGYFRASSQPFSVRVSMMEYAVKGETPDGRIMILARGFDSYEDAEDHPVKMSDWKRVWIELVSPPLMADDE
jgi:hypothetical protein